MDFDPGAGQWTMTSGGSDDAFFAEFDTDGNLVSAQSITGLEGILGHKVQVDSQGNIYVSGAFAGTAQFGYRSDSTLVSATSEGIEDGYLVRYKPNGDVDWAQIIAGDDYDYAEVSIGPGDEIYLTGFFFSSSISLDDGNVVLPAEANFGHLVSRLDDSGNVMWAGQLSSTDAIFGANGVAVDSLGNLYLHADVNDPVDLDPGPGIWWRESDGPASDPFVIVVSPDGNLLSVINFAGTGDAATRAIGLDNQENIYLAGSFSGELITPTGDVLGDVLTSDNNAYLVRVARSPGIQVFPTAGLQVGEDGTGAQFGVRLEQAPTSDLVIPVSSSDTSEGTVSISSLTFTPSYWNEFQTVTIQGVNDSIDDDNVAFTIVLGPAISTDPNYDGLDADDVSVINIDDDVTFTHTVVFADSFENGQWNGLWTEDNQNDWFTSTQRSTDGNYSAEVDGLATNATLSSIAIDMSTYGTAELTFSWYIESDFDSGEYVKLDFWNGSSWNEVLSLDGNVDQENTWHNELVHLDSEYLISNFQFRFRGKASSSAEDANVDNVQLLATSLTGPPNEAPNIITSPVTAATEDSLYTYDVDAVDPNPGDTIVFSLDAGPVGMTMNPTTGVILWTPTNDHVGYNSVIVRAQDAGGLFHTQSFYILVANVNDAPTITSVPVTDATENELYTYDVDAMDPDIGDTLTYSLDNAPAGMTIDSATGLIQWTPAGGQIGDNNVLVRVQDAGGLFATQSYTITVEDSTFTPIVVFSDSFENGQWNGLWVEDSQNDWFTSTQRATEGSHAAEVDGRATDATLTANSVDMNGYGNAELTFSWYIESGFDSGEYVKLDFWDGSSWNEILSLDGNQDQENTWHNELVQLDSQYLRSDFQFRFRAKVSGSDEDANVDNVQLLATSQALRGTATGDGPQAQNLTLADLSALTSWAETYWQHDDQQIIDYQIRFADLPGNLLGTTSGSTITIDADAAGMDWFVDTTPWESSEFTGHSGIGQQYDLLTVLTHEFGHLYGLDHADHGVMDAVLNPGERLMQSDNHEGSKLAAHAFGRETSVNSAFTKNHYRVDFSVVSALQSPLTVASDLSGSDNSLSGSSPIQQRITGPLVRRPGQHIKCSVR